MREGAEAGLFPLIACYGPGNVPLYRGEKVDKETLEYIFITLDVGDSGTVIHIPIAKRIVERDSDTITISGGESKGARAMRELPLQ